MKLSNVNFTLTSMTNFIQLNWDKYSDEASYILVKKKINCPLNPNDGIRVYIGSELKYTDNDLVNGEIYYYRLFIIYNPEDENNYISDSKCIAKTMALTDTMSKYGKYLYDSVPENVRLQDFNLNQDKPLKRFFDTIAYPFDKLDTYADSVLQQVDMETCDEQYLPYHAKWIGQLYDEKFGPDINRLILTTMNDAEPYIGTTTGLKYVLQRIFKVDVEIHVEGSVTIVYLFLDDENPWLSDPKTERSVRRIIVNYCSLRTNYSIKENLISEDEYKKINLNDNYMRDLVRHLITDEYDLRIKTSDSFEDKILYISDDIYDNAHKKDDEFTEVLSEILSDKYEKENILEDISDQVSDVFTDEKTLNVKEQDATRFIYTKPISMTCSMATTNNNFMTTATRYADTESEET